MENIEELYCHLTEIELHKPTTEIYFDYSDDVVCQVHNNNLTIYQEGNIDDNIIQNYNIDVTDKVIYVKYLSIFNIVFLATENELILYDIENKTKLFTLSVENPIIEICWNPLETLLIVIHKNYEITSYVCSKYSIEFQNKSYLGANVPVPILSGWGSIYTQFQGPKKMKKNVVTQKDVQKAPTGPPKISWRGNGELFVVNYFSNNQRNIKVFDADLNALNQSEPYTNLQDVVAFMGKGQCIACVAKNEENIKLVIFEKNCKVKAEYDMPDIKGAVKKLLYHPQMNILTVSFVDKVQNSFINIYLYSNGRWFLKQQLYYPPKTRLHNFQWLNQQEILFTTCTLIVYTSRYIENRYFRFVINRSPNTAIVAVVDGKNINFSLFDKKILPPPYYYLNFENDIPVNRITFHPIRNICVAVDSYFYVKILYIEDEKIDEILRVKDYEFDLINFQSLNWHENRLEIILHSNDVNKTINNVDKEITVTIKTENPSAHLYLPYSDTNLILPYKKLDYNSRYIYITKHLIQDLTFEFALSSNRDLYVNDNLVCSGITSVYVFKNYLILTHSNSKLYCIRLQDYAIYTNDINLNTLFNREIERGGAILTCTDLTSPQIILQMPRGNLETISCKMITIDVIENMLKENKWSDVLHVLRIEKVNSNVLIDLNPDRFHDRIEDFVRAAKNNIILMNIVTEFNVNENCFKTFYQNYSPFLTPKLNYNKRSIIEDILNYLVSTDCVKNLSSIVAIQQKHVSLKSALKSIKDIYNIDRIENESICSKILKQLLLQEYFKDVENAAYNLFDIDFLSLVYRNSMEDPKVYEPEINYLRDMDVMERKFKMCVRGRNLSGAVKYLLRYPIADEESITNFIVRNHLEDVAYLSIENYHKHFKLVTVLYAKTLSVARRYNEAGMILKRAKLYGEALMEYKRGLEWREVVSLIKKLNYNTEDEVKLLKELAEDLVKVRRTDDAVILLETYIKDYKTAVNVLFEQNHFRKSICLAETYREYHFIGTQIIPKLLEYMSTVLEKIDNYSDLIDKFTARLEIVREERISKFQKASLGIYDDQDDLYSDTSSLISSSNSRSTSRSRGTSLSSRNRRKEERKKIDLKEGGFYEDIALIRTLHILYGEIMNLGEEVRELCLAGYGYDVELTTRLHKNLCELQDKIVEKIPKIWPEVFVKEDESTDVVVSAIIQNKQDLDPEFRSPPQTSQLKSWRLELFL
ncbi:elongator complex protein 1 [Diorhabda carinulata]|uniref:elongator complex protein 1 n=1 Tax=Diorhabda carinulata TaxID=1163345 RepID=UPI0025A2A921|nr:elongator complex protein 1 [Diorhabda carinulata]